MAEKLLKSNKRKLAAATGRCVTKAERAVAATGRAVSTKPPQKIVLVGTCKENL